MRVVPEVRAKKFAQMGVKHVRIASDVGRVVRSALKTDAMHRHETD